MAAEGGQEAAPATTAPEVPAAAQPRVVDGVPLLHPCYGPRKGKPWGCLSCPVFQYTPAFRRSDIPNYEPNLDDHRWDSKCTSYQLEGFGNAAARVMVVLPSPTAGEDRDGASATGTTAERMRAMARRVDLDHKRWYFTYAVRCRGPKAPDIRVARQCSRFLSPEVTAVRPETIIAVGSVATALLLGKEGATVYDYQGVPQRVTVAGHECVVYSMLSPDFVEHNDHLRDRYLEQWRQLALYLRGRREVATDSSIYERVDTVDGAIAVCRSMLERVEAGHHVVEADLETSSLNPYLKGGRVACVSLSMSVKKGYAFPYNHDQVVWTDEDRRRFVEDGLKPLMCHPKVLLRWHNGKFDYRWFPRYMGFTPRDIGEDTMLTHYSCDENELHGLKPLALRWTDMGDYDAELDAYLSAHWPEDDPHYDLVPWGLLGKYAGMDVVAARKLARSLRARIDEQRDGAIDTLAYRVQPAYSAAITRMEDAGCFVDVAFARRVLPDFERAEQQSYNAILAEPVVVRFCRDREQEEREKKVRSYTANNRRTKQPWVLADLPPIDEKRFFEFKLGSVPQLVTLLFDKRYYGHEAVVLGKSGQPCTDKEVMNELAEKGSPIAKRIMEYRLDHVLLNTYVRPTIQRCEDQVHTIVHPNIKLHGTKTGRPSSNNPNMQNCPNKGAGTIKRMFVSRYGDEGCMIQADYSQIELRVLACLSGDKGMIEAYRNREDLHILTGRMVFELSDEQWKDLPEDDKFIYRTISKRVNFGTCYGTSGHGLMGVLKGDGVIRTEDQCQEYIDKFFRVRPRVKRWIDMVEASTADDAISRSLFGRHRRLEEVRSSVRSVVSRAMRQAVNHVVQSTASDMTLTSLTLMDQEVCVRRGDDPAMLYPTLPRRDFPVDARWRRAHICLTVYDSILVDCHHDVAADVVALMQRTMPNIIDLAHLVWGEEIAANLSCMRKVPIVADVDCGPSYRDKSPVAAPENVAHAFRIGCYKRDLFDRDPKTKWSKDMAKLAPEVAWHG